MEENVHGTDCQERLRWFHKARLGMFIHFGLYSLLERGEWVMFRERIVPNDYAQLAKRFRPDRCNPRGWAEIAVDAGMRYAVFTARHHDGFCLYDWLLPFYIRQDRCQAGFRS